MINRIQKSQPLQAKKEKRNGGFIQSGASHWLRAFEITNSPLLFIVNRWSHSDNSVLIWLLFGFTLEFQIRCSCSCLPVCVVEREFNSTHVIYWIPLIDNLSSISLLPVFKRGVISDPLGNIPKIACQQGFLDFQTLFTGKGKGFSWESSKGFLHWQTTPCKREFLNRFSRVDLIPLNPSPIGGIGHMDMPIEYPEPQLGVSPSLARSNKKISIIF